MLKDYFKAKRDVQILYSMKQRELDDIGVTTGDIIRFEKENSLLARLKAYLRSKKHLEFRNERNDVV